MTGPIRITENSKVSIQDGKHEMFDNRCTKTERQVDQQLPQRSEAPKSTIEQVVREQIGERFM